MKNILKFIIFIILVIIITVICCFIFIPDVPKFKDTSEYKYILNNINNVDEVIVRTVTLLGENCYKIDVDKGYDILNNISIKKKAKFTCTDSDMYLEFNFKNNKRRILSFECGNLIYRNERYGLKDEVIMFNVDEFVPSKITDGMIVVSNKNKIECD